MPIKDLPDDQKPREILFNRGPKYLSDVQLLAIPIGSGYEGRSAFDIAMDLLKQFGGIRGLFNAAKEDVLKVPGIKQAKLAQIMAVRELCCRFLIEEARENPIMSQPDKVFKLIRCSIKDHTREDFIVLMLDKSARLIKVVDLANGTLDKAHIHSRELVKEIINCGASKIVVAHNHPSGDPEPSKDKDDPLMRKIARLCADINAELLDFVIVGDKNYFSYKRSKRLRGV